MCYSHRNKNPNPKRVLQLHLIPHPSPATSFLPFEPEIAEATPSYPLPCLHGYCELPMPNHHRRFNEHQRRRPPIVTVAASDRKKKYICCRVVFHVSTGVSAHVWMCILEYVVVCVIVRPEVECIRKGDEREKVGADVK
ncbi:unnamed protein product [Lactuca saligna]|uniref:Uncharacterized protein n=1 Tax=Lactuca saligna TaxID=75948 RepID=A0AA35YN38_LACSI|nr:unnamed protein product [Lactuca saligna]